MNWGYWGGYSSNSHNLTLKWYTPKLMLDFEILRFLEMGISPVIIPFVDGFSSIKQKFWGTPIYGNPQIISRNL